MGSFLVIDYITAPNAYGVPKWDPKFGNAHGVPKWDPKFGNFPYITI